MSLADKIFIDNCTEILNFGSDDNDLEIRPRWSDGSPAHTKKAFGIVNTYDLSKEFPILTIRKTFFNNAIDEMLWIWQKKSNEVCKLKSSVWNAWAGEDGTIGKAYGYQLSIKHKYKEGEFDQVDRLLFDLKNNPWSRRMIVNMYNHSDLHQMNLYPCAYMLTLNVSNGCLNAILNQRSQDMLTANNWNVVQYSVLVHMLAKVSGLKVGKLLHVIADAHIYDRHIPIVEKIIKNKQFDAPTFSINQSIENFYDFSVQDFELLDYNFTPLSDKLEVAV